MTAERIVSEGEGVIHSDSDIQILDRNDLTAPPSIA